MMTMITRTDTDNSYAWDTITTWYDEMGEILERSTTYDNGVVKDQSFASGVIAAASQNDVLNVFDWDTIVFKYDEDGDVLEKTTAYDDGTTNMAIYQDNVLAGRIVLDAQDGSGGVHDWNAKMFAYAPDGSVMISATEYDDGDELFIIYAEGEKQTSIGVDNDDSDPWLMHVTEYGGVAPVTTYYDNVADIPDPYLEYLGMMVG